MRTGTNKVLRMGDGEWCQKECAGSKCLGMAPTRREVLRRPLVSAAGKKPSVSLSPFLEMNNLEIEHEVACAAACFLFLCASSLDKGRAMPEKH